MVCYAYAPNPSFWLQKRGFALLEESTGGTPARLKREFASAQKKKAKISHPTESVLAGTVRRVFDLLRVILLTVVAEASVGILGAKF